MTAKPGCRSRNGRDGRRVRERETAKDGEGRAVENRDRTANHSDWLSPWNPQKMAWRSFIFIFPNILKPLCIFYFFYLFLGQEIWRWLKGKMTSVAVHQALVLKLHFQTG